MHQIACLPRAQCEQATGSGEDHLGRQSASPLVHPQRCTRPAQSENTLDVRFPNAFLDAKVERSPPDHSNNHCTLADRQPFRLRQRLVQTMAMLASYGYASFAEPIHPAIRRRHAHSDRARSERQLLVPAR